MRNNEHEHELPPLMLPGYAESYIKLAKNRVLIVSEDVSDKLAADISAMLLYFDSIDSDSHIEMYIHSNGGAVTGLANIYDVMQMVKSPIKTICIGKCYSAAAVLLAAGTKGERYAFKNSSIMIHGVQSLFPVPGHDMTSSKNYFEYLNEYNNNIMKMLAHHTGHSVSKVAEDCKQDIWLTAKQALDYGLIDHIVS